jgi:serine-type D-Ala-D-Ala carboxypeptidase (penicillin-binding protein 5/6)
MRRFLTFLVVLVLLCGGYGTWSLTKSLPALAPVSTLDAELSATSASLPWPAYGEAAIGAVGYGNLASNGEQKPLPTASVAKVMTALSVLKKRPLQPGQSGPTITITEKDAAYYRTYVAQGGSVAPVNVGERITEYQALQALLLPSANNMAKTLADWAFGSEQAYTAFANSYAKDLGMTNSNFSDASGFSSATVSTATDLVRLGATALGNKVLAQIISQPTATIPVAGTVRNVNILLGQNGVNGIKTGNTDEAGGVFLGSGTYAIGNHKVTVITAIMGAKTLRTAMNDTLPLITSAQTNFAERTVVKKGDIVGYYNTPWGTSAHAIAEGDLTNFGWKGTTPKLRLALSPQKAPAPAGQVAGTLSLTTANGVQKVPVTLQQPLDPPSWQWRLWHH